MNNLEIRLENLKRKLLTVCAYDTTHPSCEEDWSPANPLYGHCAIVSALVYNRFGGEIVRGIIAETGISHYWNRIEGKEYDLTKEQFEKHVTLIDAQDCSVERIFKNGNSLERYNLLVERLNELPEYANDHKT